MKIIAHRGNDGVHKENSLEAIVSSLNSKYTDGVEFDIRFTKDHKFIVSHDLFTNGFFINKTCIKKLQKQGLNTLEEILMNVKNDKIILIEVKEERKHFKYLAFKLVNVLKKYNLNYYICSFNYDFLKYFKKKYPNYKAGLLIGKKTNLKHVNNDFDFNSIYIGNLDKNKKENVFTWTVNDYSLLDGKMINVITDNCKKIYNSMHNIES